jgi:hypothetical protein
VSTHLRRLWHWAVEHPILAVFIVALAVRAVVAVGINVLHDGTLFADDRFFFDLAHDKATGADAQWDPYERDLFTRTATFLWPLTGVFIVTGTTLLAGQLLVAIAGAGAAALTTAVGLRALRPPFALFAGIVVAVLPSMVLWSSLTLKDAFVWCTVAGMGLAVCELSGSARRFIAVAAVTVVLVVLLSHLRDHSTVVALWALAASLAIGPGADRRRRATFGVAMLLVMPAVLGYGVAGISFYRDATTSLEERREGNAVGASSALTCDRGRQGFEAKIEHLPCGFPAVMLRPYPWESAGSTSVRLARFEAILWYPLLAAALYGATRSWPLRRWLAFPAVNGAMIVVVYALTEGNLGTAFRHRAEAIWAVALFAAVALEKVVGRRREPEVPLRGAIREDMAMQTAPTTLTRGNGG